MSDWRETLPKRLPQQLAADLRRRADHLGGHDWEVAATVSMMREAADAIDDAHAEIDRLTAELEKR
jgi:hypothetical protein